MERKEWTDEQLEELLKQMPKVRDNRDSNELYRAISIKVNKKKRTGWIIPSLATAAALALLVMLVPNIANWDSAADLGDSNESNSMEFANKEMEPVAEDNVSFRANDNENKDAVSEQVLERTAVYQDDLDGKELLVYAIPDRNAQNIVPVSILVSKDDTKSWFEQWLETMPKLSEEEWGLADYYPLNGTWKINREKREVIFDVPEDHQYGWGSAAEENFKNSIEQTFRYSNEIDKITFKTAGNSGIVLGNDELQQIELNSAKSSVRPYYLLFVENQMHPLFIPYGEPLANLEETFAAMKKSIDTHGLQPTIPAEIQIDSINSQNDTLTVLIGDKSTISQTPEMVYAIEAFLLIAKDSGYKKVEIKKTGVENIGPFRLNQAIDVPEGANKQEIMP